ncbi:unnamed protein product [Amoebophrya sp. A25]|nr:unnamed protein product [Amoebophrya sp. A25]|eukprot:GSA25T00027070001.1
MVLIGGRPHFSDDHKRKCIDCMRTCGMKYAFIGYRVALIAKDLDKKLLFSAYREITWG